MRKQRDGDDTKERVLSAAQVLFAENGFSGTSLAMIAKKSGISDGLILHHFQSKKNLYDQVLETMASRYTQELVKARSVDAHPEEMMMHTLTAAFNFWKEDSTYYRISLWAYLEKQPQLAQQEAALTAGLFQAVHQLQEKKMIDDRVSPLVILSMVIGSIHFWVRYRDQFIKILNLTETSEALDRMFLEQLVELVKKMAMPSEPSEKPED